MASFTVGTCGCCVNWLGAGGCQVVSSALDTSRLRCAFGLRVAEELASVALRGSRFGFLGLDTYLDPVDFRQLVEYSPSVFLGKED